MWLTFATSQGPGWSPFAAEPAVTLRTVSTAAPSERARAIHRNIEISPVENGTSRPRSGEHRRWVTGWSRFGNGVVDPLPLGVSAAGSCAHERSPSWRAAQRRPTPGLARCSACAGDHAAPRGGDVALGRLDVLPSLHGIEPGLWALDLLERRGVTVLNGRDTLAAAHDKLATADALACAGIPHPSPRARRPLAAAARSRASARAQAALRKLGGDDATRCNSPSEVERAFEEARLRVWFNATGGVLQRLIPPLRPRLARGRGGADGWPARSCARHRPAEWRTNVALGARRIPAIHRRTRASWRSPQPKRSAATSSASTCFPFPAAAGWCSR